MRQSGPIRATPGRRSLGADWLGSAAFFCSCVGFHSAGGRPLQKPSVCGGGVVTRGFHDYRMTGKSLGTARVGGLSLKLILGGL